MNKIENIKQELKTKYKESLKMLELLKLDIDNYNKLSHSNAVYNNARQKIESNKLNKYNVANKTAIKKSSSIIEEYEQTRPYEKAKDHANKFIECYLTGFYSTSKSIKFLYQEKYQEFNSFYYNQNTTESRHPVNFKICNYLKNEKLNHTSIYYFNNEYERIKIVYDNFNNQRLILKAIIDNFYSFSFNYEKETYMPFQEENIDSTQELFDNNFIRASGAICGVIIEKHLKNKLLSNTPSDLTPTTLTIDPLNKECKKNNIYTKTEFKKILHLTDIRNLCDHKTTKDPTKD